ncbi:hypothetical protein WA158_008304 [Blastocystis sp. Blastoise]
MSFIFDGLFNDPIDDLFDTMYRPLRMRRHLLANPCGDKICNECDHACKKGKKNMKSNESDQSLCTIPKGDLINPFYGFGRMDIKENKDNYEVHADLPGMEKDQIDVNIKDNMITIGCERKEEKKEDDDEKHYHYSERHFGTYKRSMSIPDDIDAEHITAEYTNGVLKVTIPKTKVAEKETKKITIQ